MPFEVGQREACRTELMLAERTGKELATEYGVSLRTITALRTEIKETGADLEEVPPARVQKIKKNLLGSLYDLIHQTFAAITPDKIAKTSAAQLALISGIIFDKIRLLEGKSTANHAHSLQAIIEIACSGRKIPTLATAGAPAPPSPCPSTPQATTKPRTDDATAANMSEVLDAAVDAVDTQPDATPAPSFPGVKGTEAVDVQGVNDTVEVEELF